MNKTENEVWKIYPDYDFIQGSNFGRVRTIERYVSTSRGNGKRPVKGHDLKQYLVTGGYLEVSPRINGKTVHLRVHRIIASCFLPNPDNLPEVNHRDCNPTNNTVSNLEWCSHQYNIDYKEKCGISAAEAVGRPLWAFDLKTGHKSYFNTQVEAERKIGVANESINRVLKGKYQQAGGYYFTEDEDEVTEKKLLVIKDNMHFLGGVVAIDLKTLDVLRFKTRTEAGQQLGFSESGIGGVLAGRHKQTHGFWFCHADSNAVENTRAKFGDEVANEVAENMHLNYWKVLPHDD